MGYEGALGYPATIIAIRACDFPAERGYPGGQYRITKRDSQGGCDICKDHCAYLSVSVTTMEWYKGQLKPNTDGVDGYRVR